ncbi:recombinase family protein [Deefgea rivuli]|uniref:recombinase family protein n=1 Tax=Deefgea rivuli TaxID=400948 RepID=UPI000486977D|nr:recombinase family protein [Deefgea rivuli]
MSRTFSYCRVSTIDQTNDNQELQIKEAGFKVTSSRAFVETISGKTCAMQRPAFSELIGKLEEGDTLVVSKLDRLGRDTSDVLATITKLEAMGVKVHCLALGGMDLTSAAGKMTVTVLAAVAQFERDLLVERTQAGLQRAKAEGKTLGRPTTIDAEKAAAILADLPVSSIRKVADRHKVSAGTVQRIIAANRAKEASA